LAQAFAKLKFPITSLFPERRKQPFENMGVATSSPHDSSVLNSADGKVDVQHSKTVIPTYPLPDPTAYPMYFDSRVYQGSCGAVYPLPFYDKVSDEKVNAEWSIVVIENAHIRVEVLPELGGRLHRMLDKASGYDVFYKQEVIKPALVGLSGPWMSGGIEFNWPQHHRPGTWMPTDVHIEREKDGSVTVWLSEHDPIQRMKGMHGFRIRPNSSVLEARVRLTNRTDMTRTFLWWANVAVHVHDEYQSFFPEDVTFVADHAARAMSSFPMAKNLYYGVDYRPGTDLTWYKNIPVPTSYMVRESDFDFFGGFDHKEKVGFVHIADRFISPGKKQWTWGNHPFGYAWDRELCDDGRPYIELMAGVYTDNQPDFTYLAPYEVKTFSQYWWPIRDHGCMSNANTDAGVVLRFEGKALVAAVVVSRKVQAIVIVNDEQGRPLAQFTGELTPAESWETRIDREVALRGGENISVHEEGSKVELIRHTIVVRDENKLIPSPMTAAPEPSTLTSDELVFVGEHLEQYRHPTRNPQDWWEEALQKDSGDYRANLYLGRLSLEKGNLAVASKHLEAAVARITRWHPNPVDGEAHYLLGLTYRRLDRNAEAYKALSKAAWSYAWRAPAYYQCACIESRRGQFSSALQHCIEARKTNVEHPLAGALQASMLRLLGHASEAVDIAEGLLAMDCLDHRALFELIQAHKAKDEFPLGMAEASARFKDGTRGDGMTLTDIAYDLLDAGLHADAAEVLALVSKPGPLVHYARAYIAELSSDTSSAAAHREAARASSLKWCFPSRPYDEVVLESAAASGDDVAKGLLGHMKYHAKRRDAAIADWTSAVKGGVTDPVVLRNLGQATVNHLGNDAEGLKWYARALEAKPKDARLLFEWDELRRRLGHRPEDRLSSLLAFPEAIAERDDLSVQVSALFNRLGRFADARDHLLKRRFHPWEGGEGMALREFVTCHVALARVARKEGRLADARALAELALNPPESLGETWHLLQALSDVWLELGRICASEGDTKAAHAWWEKAAGVKQDFEGMSVAAHSRMDFFKIKALQALGRSDEARAMLNDFLSYSLHLENTKPEIDYFATSLPDFTVFKADLCKRDRISAHFFRGLALLCKDDAQGATTAFQNALELDPAHVEAALGLSETGLLLA